VNARQLLVAAGTLVLGGVIVAGATQISSEAGYGGVGPNFLPWVVGLALLACGGWLAWEAASGGFRGLYAEDGDAEHANWPGFAWMSAGILLNALLITHIGFILSCALCFVLAVSGLRQAEARLDLRPTTLLRDVAIGLAVAAPVYWMFTKALAINLPGLTETGWI
jgi:putative tricarboxylic transport membrane protein